MNFTTAKDHILIALIGIGVSSLIWMASSVSTLNINVAVILEKLGNHEVRINKLESKGK